MSENGQVVDIAQHVADMIKEKSPSAVVQVNPNLQIPHHIGTNLLEFLRRTPVTGMESLAWAEAYQFVQQNTTASQTPGVPFNGLPVRK